MSEKTCTKCHSRKPLSDYHRQKRSHDGYHARCKACRCERNKQERRENPERVRTREKAAYSRNKESHNARSCVYFAKNRDRLLVQLSNYAKANKERFKDARLRSHVRRMYGLSPERYAEMLSSQNGRCGICKVEMIDRICVDHNHSTSAVRGLLCVCCNSALGGMKDDVKRLKSAIGYLNRPQKPLQVDLLTDIQLPRHRPFALKRKYGLSVPEFATLLRIQNGQCAICNEGRNLVVDHCHQSSRVRGLLCHSCNYGIGMFGDNSETINSAITYLTQHAQ